MPKYLIHVLLVLLIFSLLACSSAKNYEEGYAVMKNGQPNIKLKGKRIAMSHDLISLFKNNTYEDSILIPVPSFYSGKIDGKNIPVEEGNYKYLGTITIEDENLKMDLYYDNTDDKIKDPVSWNGKYTLKRE